MERRKLFSTSAPQTRRKLFSSESNVEAPMEQSTAGKVRCMDCGYVYEVYPGSTTNQPCPKCGGIRAIAIENAEKTFSAEGKERRKLFSEPAEDLGHDTELELKLKEFSGQEIDPSALGFSAEELCEKGFADVCEDGIKISDTAYLQSKLFSKMIITVTRELDLDEDIMTGKCDKKEVISKIEEKEGLSPKGIILIKKAHGIPVEKENNSWIHDSGIGCDLPLEFGGMHKELPDFKKTLDERYPDAPEDIIDLLREKGIIKVEGNNVEIIK